MPSPITGMRLKPLRSASDMAWRSVLVALDEDDVGARHHHLADDGVAELEDGVDHHPLAVLDELVLLGEVDQVAQLGLGRERSLAEALAGRERVADQDQQLRQRAEHPGQRVHDPGRRAARPAPACCRPSVRGETPIAM